MNRFIVFLASIGLACLAISSTCLASPIDVRPNMAWPSNGAAQGWTASLAPSEIVGGSLLSL